ncbi:ABC transporter ATP-binding protein [Marinobacterium jannaschii]|uniref:ABC transporter ATP-binding protein n=1 Tax=Marinobacterium jannaschii TaxID=64970 RepID=UPI00048986E8|nr:energy-coupling factor ABC transporter ATP-binding protein [Marinobacterium jannaschii]
MALRLEARQLVKRFGARELFRIPEFNLRAGESLYLQGENGVGKTTLMKILAGLDKPCDGSVRLLPARRRWWLSALDQKVIYLHQTPYVFAGSVADNIAYGLRYRGFDQQTIRQRVALGLRWSRLEALAEHDAVTLSGGEKQRMALARAWVLEPQLLLLDEPTANLDVDSVSLVADMVSGMVADGAAVIVSSHQKTALTRLCQRRLHLINGQLREVFSSTRQEQYGH